MLYNLDVFESSGKRIKLKKQNPVGPGLCFNLLSAGERTRTFTPRGTRS